VTGFDSFAVVDWSGGNDTGPKPRKDAIWAAVATGAGGAPPVYLRNRQVAETWLSDLIGGAVAEGRRLLLGFDFPFGFPRGFAQGLLGRDDPLALWDLVEGQLRDSPLGNDRFALAGRLNAAFPGVGPFWFNAGRDEVEGLPRRGRERTATGLPERRLVEERARGAFTCWQLGGAGAVGSQALTGMATLARLRRRFPGHVAVWPFGPLDRPVAFVEVWPSLLAPVVTAETGPGDIRDAVQVRVLARVLAEMQRAGTLAPALNAVPDPARRAEGWILGVGAEAALADAASRSAPALPGGVRWTPVGEALERLRDLAGCVCETEGVGLVEAPGRVLAEAAVAARDSPPAANAAVDGYAFRHDAAAGDDVALPLAPGRAAAGAPFPGPVPDGHAIRILTGAAVPPGADTIALQEEAVVASGRVRLRRVPRSGANIRRAGEDVAAGAVVLPAGRRIAPQDVALLASVGTGRMSVRRRLRVGVASTGDELAEAGTGEAGGRIFDANRPMLLSLLDRWDHDAVDLGRVADDRAALKGCLDAAASRVDVVLTSGGASSGDEDHVAALMRDEGEIVVWRVAMKPGRPFLAGRWRGKPILGLPGNPVAAMITTLVFARPVLSVLAGAGWTAPVAYSQPAGFEKRKKAGRREYLRARLGADGRVEAFASEGSGRVSGLSWAEGLVELPDAAVEIRPGDRVAYLPWASFGI
jgi:molybdopterin molybdotransferase